MIPSSSPVFGRTDSTYSLPVTSPSSAPTYIPTRSDIEKIPSRFSFCACPEWSIIHEDLCWTVASSCSVNEQCVNLDEDDGSWRFPNFEEFENRPSDNELTNHTYCSTDIFNLE
eukprot:UN33555